jgi:integrase
VSVKELFENHITMIGIQQACKMYVETSKKAKTIESIQRYLSAMDSFIQYIAKKGVRCIPNISNYRNKEVICEICESINSDLKQKIYLPFDNPAHLEIVEEQIKLLKRDKFYQLGQIIIYRLMLEYGFKEGVIINLKVDDFDADNNILIVNADDSYVIRLKMREALSTEIKNYYRIHTFPEREYMFTKANGKQLKADSVFGTLKEKLNKLEVKNFNPTSVALKGVSDLIKKGLSIAEINALTGFESQKIMDVSRYLLLDKDINQTINDKLTN